MINAERPLKNIVFILVNARVKPESSMEQTAKNPSPSTTMDAVTSAQIDRYSQETVDRLRSDFQGFNAQFIADGTPTRIYFSEVGFEHVENESLNKMLNSLPTTLELDDDEIDQLITAGRILLRREPSYMRFVQQNKGQLVEGAITSEEVCSYFHLDECAR